MKLQTHSGQKGMNALSLTRGCARRWAPRGQNRLLYILALLGPLDFRFVSRLDQDGSLGFLFFQRRDLVLPTIGPKVHTHGVSRSDNEDSDASHNLVCLGPLVSLAHGPDTAIVIDMLRCKASSTSHWSKPYWDFSYDM